MTSKKWLGLVAALAAILFVNSIWLFYRHVDQGVTLSYCDSMLVEKRQSTGLLEALVRSRLIGNLNKQDFIELLKTHAIPYYPLEGDDVLFASYLVFTFEDGILQKMAEAVKD